MGKQIIKQPNGKFALWSTIIDHFICYDCTEEDLVKFQLQDYEKKIREDMHSRIEILNKGEQAYHQFTISWEEALDLMKDNHSKKEYNDFIKEYKASQKGD